MGYENENAIVQKLKKVIVTSDSDNVSEKQIKIDCC
jgi:hypothetical protein